MMKKLHFIFYLIIFSFFNLYGYEINTHIEISKITADNLWLNKSHYYLNDFGVKYTDKFLGKTLQLHMADGANFEDNNVRPLNHFYDPYHDIGLSGFPPGIKSSDWALEDNELLDLPKQEFSINDASDYFYRALTGKDLPLGETRETNFGKLFLTLGHVIHHVQDMA